MAGAASAEAAAATLSRLASVVAVKQGASGGLARSGEEIVTARALEIDRVIDTTGAGDSFDAGFLAGRLLGWSLARCLQLACACGSLSTRFSGGTDGQPTMEEVTEAIGPAL
jgi:sugar/nucleoside kinase (ribokinase family)